MAPTFHSRVPSAHWARDQLYPAPSLVGVPHLRVDKGLQILLLCLCIRMCPIMCMCVKCVYLCLCVFVCALCPYYAHDCEVCVFVFVCVCVCLCVCCVPICACLR